MKKWAKRIIEIVLVLFIVLNVIEGFSAIDQDKIYENIERYYEDEKNDEEIISVKNLGTKKYGMFINEYELIEVNTYNYEGNRVIAGDSAWVCPVKNKLISLFGHYKILWTSKPDEGESYDKSLKKIFPKDILEDLDNNYDYYVNELHKDVKQKLENIMSK